MIDFLEIAWPGLLALLGFVALIIAANRDHRRRHPRGHYRLHEQGRVLASQRDDLIAQGVDPRELRIPLWPER